MKVLGRENSINVRKVLWACDELGLSYEHEAWGLEDRPLASEEFQKLNPNGKIPVLIDGETTLSESNTIIRYLANREGNHDLYPAEPARRAAVDMWMDWQAAELNPTWRYAFHGLVRNNPNNRDEMRIQESLDQWTKHMDMLETRLAGTAAYVAGNAFTLADIPIGLAVNRWFMTPGTSYRHPATAEYYERLSARPAFMRHGRNGVA